MPKGTIRRLMDRGFGFIKGEEEGDLFFHRNDIEGVEFESLREGQEVEFEKGQGRDGRPQAVKVRLAQPIANVNLFTIVATILRIDRVSSTLTLFPQLL